MCYIPANSALAKDPKVIRLLFWLQLQLCLMMLWMSYQTTYTDGLRLGCLVLCLASLAMVISHKNRLNRLENRHWTGKRLAPKPSLTNPEILP